MLRKKVEKARLQRGKEALQRKITREAREAFQDLLAEERSHQINIKRLEQARINRTLDDERISSISLVQPASYMATPAGPRRLFVLALGVMVAAGTAAGVVFASAWLNPLLATTEKLAAVIDLPIAGVVPRRDLLAAA